MKILAISDQVVERLYSVAVRTAYPDVEMLIGCGDLPYEYLEFLVSIYNIPLVYVPGNHDPEHSFQTESYAEGGINIDGDAVCIKGLFLAGLGGSIRYQPHGANQYTQFEMYLRVWRLLPRFWSRRLRYRRPLDILVAHSPPSGIHDDDDPPHQGLKALNLLISLTKPRYFLHGHTMFYRQNLKSHVTQYKKTKIINIYPFRIMEI